MKQKNARLKNESLTAFGMRRKWMLVVTTYIAPYFALATRNGMKENGGVTTKVVVWFMFGDEEGSKVTLEVEN